MRLILPLLVGASITFSHAAQPGETPRFKTPPGVSVQRVAGDPAVRFPMFACFDDRGRLFVAESSGLDLYEELVKQTRRCRVSVLEDRDGDGVFEHAQVFADKLVFPMGLAWRDGRLYVADPPDLVTFADDDGDGRADQGSRRVLLTGFGHTDNGSLHGLVFGPDERLYMTSGNPDGYRLRRSDGGALVGQSGALVRCRPDGSEIEVVSRGFENLVELVFLPDGEMIGTVNWYQKPAGGMRDALVQLVEGGLFPLHADKGTPHLISGEPLPPAAMFPAVALSGMALYRGPHFPEFRGQLFTAQHNTRMVGRHVLRREGSALKADGFELLATDDPDFHPSDVLEDADGSLLVIDTGGWYVQHCPTGKIRDSKAPGGIFRVKRDGAVPPADPWGSRIDWSSATPGRLAALLSDTRPAVAERARRTLGKLGEHAVPALAGLLKESPSTEASQHAIWSLAAIRHSSSLIPLREALRSREAPVVQTACRALALRRDKAAAPLLLPLLRHPETAVRLSSAEALAHCGDAMCLPPMLEALSAGPDRFLEHALIHVVYRIAGTTDLERWLAGANPQGQQVALLLLDQPPHQRIQAAAVLPRLSSPHSPLRATAQRALRNHPEWAAGASDYLRAQLGKATLSQDDLSALRENLLALQSRTEVPALLGAALADAALPADRRVFVLDVMSRTAQPKLPDAWAQSLEAALKDPATRSAAVRTATTLGVPGLDDALSAIAADGGAPVGLRIDALSAVLRRRPKVDAAMLGLLLDGLRQKDAPALRLAAAEAVARCELDDSQLAAVLNTVNSDALVSPDTLLPMLARSTSHKSAVHVLEYLEAAAERGWRADTLQLSPLLEKLRRGDAGRAEALPTTSNARLAEVRQRLDEYQPLLQGGDARAGRAVFFGGTVACAACHRLGDEGGRVGPDLTRVGAIRSGRDLLESIVAPSSTFAQGYDSYLVTTRSGEAFAGVLIENTSDGVMLREPGGTELRIPASQVRRMRRGEVSIMPEGLDRALTREQLRDLLAFLQSLK